MLSLSQGNSILDAFLTAKEELITQCKSPGSCELCTVELGLGHGGSTITFPPRSIGLIQLTSQCGWAALMQLRAVLGVWVGVEVGGQCFHRLSTPSSSFQGDATESRYFACHRVRNSMKLWSAVSRQGQALPISRLGVSFVRWSRVPRASLSFSGGKVWRNTGFSVHWGRLSQLS